MERIALLHEMELTGSDDFVLEAVMAAPHWKKLISDASIVAAAKEARGRRQRPQLAQQLNSLQAKRSSLRAMLDTIKIELGVPDDDPLARIASGDGDAVVHLGTTDLEAMARGQTEQRQMAEKDRKFLQAVVEKATEKPSGNG